MNVRQRIAVVILDVMMIVEVCVAMYFASRNPDDFTLVFLKVFFSALIPTLGLAWLVIRKLCDARK